MRDRIMEYLYDDEAVFMKIRDGEKEKPEGIELLIDYAKEINDKLRNNLDKHQIYSELLFVFDIIYNLLDFSNEIEWTKKVADEMYFVLTNEVEL